MVEISQIRRQDIAWSSLFVLSGLWITIVRHLRLSLYIINLRSPPLIHRRSYPCQNVAECPRQVQAYSINQSVIIHVLRSSDHRPYTEIQLVLEEVIGALPQFAQRSFRRNPAIRAMRSSSEGHA